MAPGVGGFNIDPPVPMANPVEDKVAVAHTRRQTLPNPDRVVQAPIRAQRMAVIVDSGASSFTPRLLAVVAIVGLREQAGHRTASDFCAARHIFSCQAWPSTHEVWLDKSKLFEQHREENVCKCLLAVDG